jgi:hypothetical protein
MSEADILAEVLVAVTGLPDACAWRANSGVLLSPDGMRRIRANVTGCADVIGCKAGRAIAIETKTLRGIQRKEQQRFQRNWESAGGLYIIARSAAEALAALA